MREVTYGATGVTTNVYLTNAIGLPVTGLLNSTVGLGVFYARCRAAATVINLQNINIYSPYSSGGFVAVDSGNMPGTYRLDIPDNAFTGTNVNFVNIFFTGANIYSPPFEIPIVAYDPTNLANDAYDMFDATSGVETNYTLRQALRLILSSCVAKLTGATAGTGIYIRDINDTKNRIVAGIDQSGNRNNITYDVT